MGSLDAIKKFERSVKKILLLESLHVSFNRSR